jgi:hypothetical protein
MSMVSTRGLCIEMSMMDEVSTRGSEHCKMIDWVKEFPISCYVKRGTYGTNNVYVSGV